jgi:hypothetical protein
MISGAQSIGTRVVARRSNGAYLEWRRLTIRGERLFSVRVARIWPQASSSSLNHRRRRLGCAGGKGPGVGLRAAK